LEVSWERVKMSTHTSLLADITGMVGRGVCRVRKGFVRGFGRAIVVIEIVKLLC
jgi:hypothetical protein